MVFIPPKDRVLEHSTSNSQTVFTVTGAVDASMNAFSAHMSVGDTTIGGVVEPGIAFKSGVLTYSATNQVTIDSTGFESKGTFSSSGTKEVFMGMPAKSMPMINISGAAASYFAPQGRLSLTNGVAVPSASVSAATTLYYSQYAGNLVPVNDGTNMVPFAFSTLSIVTTDTTKNPSAIGAGKVNDWFIWNDAGTLRLCHGPDWTSDTTPSAGTALVLVNGILLNAVAITNACGAQRGTWVGTTRSNASSTLDLSFGASGSGGVAALLNVWNAYNKVILNATVSDSGTNYQYTSSTPRQARGSAGNQISFVSGAAEDGISASYQSDTFTQAAVGAATFFGVGLDSTSTFYGRQSSNYSPTAASSALGTTWSANIPAQKGAHVISANEAGDNVNANYFSFHSLSILSANFRM